MPRHSPSLAARLEAVGADVRLKLYPGIGHVEILAAVAIPFRGRVPVLADVARFAKEVTGP